jgi:hypothetical protein
MNRELIYSICVKNGGNLIFPAPWMWKNQKLKYFSNEKGFSLSYGYVFIVCI